MSKQNGKATSAYLRISGEKQDTARQERRIAATGLPVTLWFRDETGKNPRDQAHKRKAFQEMLRAVEAGLIGTIVVDRQDRFGVADAYEWGKFITLLRENGTTLVDADGKVLSALDDVSILTGTLGAITSTREQKEKAHRNITGKVSKAKEGEYQGGYPPYGLDVVCFGANGKEKWRTVYVGSFKRIKVYPDGRREHFDGKDNAPRKDPTDKMFLRPSIEKNRIKVAGQVFDWYATEATSPRQIATRLVELEVDPIYGKQWDKVRIREMLGNPAYIGFPTWNKKGGSRFVEYLDGKFQEVTDKKGGRKRAEGDYVKPLKPLYKPLVPLKTWEAVQAKLQKSSDECRAVPRRSADTAELYLREFVVCGHCGRPMHATSGRSTEYLWPSYFCATYGKYGPTNPTGCHCHRVQHSVLERIIRAYLSKTAPKVGQLLNAADTGNLEAVMPLLESHEDALGDRERIVLDVLKFVVEHGDVAEVKRLVKDGYGYLRIYGVLYERKRPELEKQIQLGEDALDQMMNDYRGLPAKLKDRAGKKMEAAQEEIDRLRTRLNDLRQPWGDLREELTKREEAIERAVKMLSKEGAGRQKAEALRGAISTVTCWFRHTVEKGRKRGSTGKENNGKSFLEKVEIESVSGDVYTSFTDGNMPVPG